jgi:hypothetical protein
VQLAGGTLMGSVLEGAPAPPGLHIFPKWLWPIVRSSQ